MSLRLALYQPDIPANTGSMMRLCACLGVPLDIIEPCGFVWDDKKLRRVAMDYIDHLSYERHVSWQHFEEQTGSRRLVLLTTKGASPYTSFTFQPDDLIMVGRESAGVPDNIHNRADARLIIPMNPQIRSLNVALSASIVLGEALRQIGK
ncbi:MAG TPA: tRNA methyltransferase [Rhodospirillaceae bacterium]|nr:tRNA methyltransferase [Rhodospirillaceae bacterium]